MSFYSIFIQFLCISDLELGVIWGSEKMEEHSISLAISLLRCSECCKFGIKSLPHGLRCASEVT